MPPQNPNTEKWTTQQVLSIHYWTPKLLSFQITRPENFNFTPGHYTRLGLQSADGTTVWRPYSLVSSPDANHLEFLAILVPGGNFSSLLAGVQVESPIQVDRFSLGFLTLDQLAIGSDLWMLASGTGLGPFISILRDPLAWKRFQKLILVHSVRYSTELAYQDLLSEFIANSPFPGTQAKLSYFPIVTRETGTTQLTERIPQLLVNNELPRAAGSKLDLDSSRLMVCGNPEMAREVRQFLSSHGFATSRRGVPGQMAFEKYW